MIRTNRHITRVVRRNQVTIPAQMLRELGLGPGESVQVERTGSRIAIEKVPDPVEHAYGLLKQEGDQPRSDADCSELEDNARAWRSANAAADDERILRRE